MKYFCVVFVCFFSFPLFSTAQLAQQTGIIPYQSYDESSFDTVDLLGGAVQLHIPIISYPQKGTLPSLGLQLVYNTPTWSQFSTSDFGGGNHVQWVFNAPISSGVTITPSYTGTSFPDGEDQNHDPLLGISAVDASGAAHQMFGVVSPAGVETNAYETVDGTGIGITLNSAGVAAFTDRNGIRYSGGCVLFPASCTSTTATYMQDPSGNSVILSYPGGLTDSIGRPIPLFSNQFAVTPAAKCEAQQYPVVGGTTAPITICWQQYTAASAFEQGNVAEGSSTFIGISSVTLQNGASWSLTYDSWGFLHSVTTPTGAVMTYGYYPPSSQYPASQSIGQRYLQSRTLNVNGATSQWSYAYSTTTVPGFDTNFQTIVTDPLSNTVTHIFDENGTELQTLYRQGEAQTLLKTIQYTYVMLGFRAYIPKQTTTIYPNGSSTTTCVIFDNNTNTTCSGTDAFNPGGLKVYDPNDKLRGIPGFTPYSASLVLGSPMYSYVYDYTSGSGPSVLLSETTNTYQWQGNDNYRAANLLNLVSSSFISTGGSAQSSKTYTYDETAYGPTGTFGNATTEVDGGSITTHASYNTKGMTTGTQDSKGNPTTIVYDSTGAYPKTVTRPPTNGVAHVDNYVYDGNTGLMTSHIDENQNVTAYTYDSMRRPKSITYPDLGQDSYVYDDTAPSPTITHTKNLTATTKYETVAIADALGRQIRTELLSDPEGTVYTDTTYDGVGNVISISNPYRSNPSPSDGITTFAYDGLGRKTVQTQPDKSLQQWCYNGILSGQSSSVCLSNQSSQTTATWVDYSDETNSHSQRVSDALGRLIAVMEPDPVSNVPSFETDYQYSALGNLTRVDQWAGSHGTTVERTRVFNYDSLSRLISATNPETGAVTYQYVANGLPCAGDVSLPCNKTDARGVTINYMYDALNRIIGKTYSGTGSAGAIAVATPSSCYQYDTGPSGATGGNFVGRLTFEWTQFGLCPSTIPASGYNTMRSILAYDPMGRVQMEQQCSFGTCTTGQPYTLNSSYDLAGNQMSYDNGLGTLTLTNSYDGADRLFQVTSNFNDPTHPQSLYYVSNFAPIGLLQNGSMGNSLSITKTYDSRQRVITGLTAVNQ